ncbi:MAG TPA: prepilin-type N-terminal cleavage/methylation domain-containing protein [Candidatus Hydromicrobium sp.]
MKWLYRNLYRKKKGFTLVELMVVIIILAVLTAIAIPSYMALRNRARTAAAQSEMKNIATALEVYNADEEAYPIGDFDVMVEALEGDVAIEGDEYMVDVPDLDPWGTVPYEYGSDGTTYTLTCASGTPDIVIIDGQLQ